MDLDTMEEFYEYILYWKNVTKDPPDIFVYLFVSLSWIMSSHTGYVIP